MTPMRGLRTTTIRRRVISYDDALGEWVTTTSSTFTIRASFQPISGRERSSLPEGYRNTAREKLFSTSELFTSTTSASPPNAVGATTPGVADLVERRGAWYEVLTVEDWRDHLLPHFKYVIGLRDVDDTPT